MLIRHLDPNVFAITTSVPVPSATRPVTYTFQTLQMLTGYTVYSTWGISGNHGPTGVCVH